MLFHALIAEFLISALKTLLLVMYTNQKIYMLAVVFGLVACITVFIFGEISGAHGNPAVTLFCYFLGYTSLKTTISYVAIQLAGSVAASYALQSIVMTPGQMSKTIIWSDNLQREAAMEFLGTMLMLFAWKKVWDMQCSLTKADAGLQVAIIKLCIVIFPCLHKAFLNLILLFGPLCLTGTQDEWKKFAAHAVSQISAGLLVAYMTKRKVCPAPKTKKQSCTLPPPPPAAHQSYCCKVSKRPARPNKCRRNPGYCKLADEHRDEVKACIESLYS